MSLALTVEQREELRAFTRERSVDSVVADRARMVLWRGDGYSVAEVAGLAGTTRPTVYKWSKRFLKDGISGLADEPRPGKPAQVSGSARARILALTKTSPPKELGISHWSSREMAAFLRRREGIGVSHNFVADLWRRHGLAPHRQGTFKLSKDPAFAKKVGDVVGLYLDPPGGAIVLSVDEKTQVQALDRTQPLLPITFGKAEQRTHDYVRHGTTNLFAALNVGTGQVHADCFSTKTGEQFLAFMKKVTKQYAGREIHVVLDNLSTHGTDEIDKWLEKNPNITFHFTPTGSSWLNQVEIWFGIITRQAIRRGTFSSLRHLISAINDFIDHWNSDCEPFNWTATTDEILAKVQMIQTDVRKMLDNNGK
jgi:transposase